MNRTNMIKCMFSRCAFYVQDFTSKTNYILRILGSLLLWCVILRARTARDTKNEHRKVDMFTQPRERCTGTCRLPDARLHQRRVLFGCFSVGGLALSPSVCGLKDMNKLSPFGAVELYEALCAGKGSELLVTYLFEIRKFSGSPTPEVYLSEISAL